MLFGKEEPEQEGSGLGKGFFTENAMRSHRVPEDAVLCGAELFPGVSEPSHSFSPDVWGAGALWGGFLLRGLCPWLGVQP